MLCHMLRATLAVVAVAIPQPLLAQAMCTLQVDGAVGGVRVVGDAEWSGRGRSVLTELPSGAWQLRFAAGSGARAAAIKVDAPAHGAVRVAIGRCHGEVGDQVLAATATTAMPFAVENGPNVRLRAGVRIVPLAGAIGIACRWQGPDDHYRFVWDESKDELSLVRAMGGDLRVLGRAPAPAAIAAAEYHELELEAEGFRLTAYCDGEEVLRAMDGGLDRGACATWAAAGVLPVAADGDEPPFVDVALGAPAITVATLCAITEGHRVRVVATAKLAVDCPFSLWLRLDRPTPLWITDDSGLEPYLLRTPSEPVFLPFAHGTVDRDGMLRGELEWPPGAALHLQAALIGGFLGTPDGSALLGRLPWAQLRF